MSDAIALSIVIATGGRPSLRETLHSVTPQLESGDEIIVSRLDCLVGNRARNLAMPRCAGSHIMFLDDDDLYAPNALATVREALREDPDVIHLFAMRYMNSGQVIVPSLPLFVGKVGTPMMVIPNEVDKLGSWPEDQYAGDWFFFDETYTLLGGSVKLHNEVIAWIG